MPIHTELVIARHGEAVCNVTGRVGGPTTCTGLTPRGQAQVQALATLLVHEHHRRRLDVLYTSPRPRTQQSATILADALGLTPIVREELRGPDHGDADGQLWVDVKSAFGGSPQRHPDLAYASGAEPWTSYLERAGCELRRLLDQHEGQRILIAGHGETILAANALLLELAPGLSVRAGFTAEHAGVTWWQQQVNRFGHATWMLTRHNDTRHLDDPSTRMRA